MSTNFANTLVADVKRFELDDLDRAISYKLTPTLMKRLASLIRILLPVLAMICVDAFPMLYMILRHISRFADRIFLPTSFIPRKKLRLICKVISFMTPFTFELSTRRVILADSKILEGLENPTSRTDLPFEVNGHSSPLALALVYEREEGDPSFEQIALHC